ncbi:hypothetical protein VHEMI08215 [[Torrubiella] hemipterigena]|uniref:Peptidase S53 activation domain-containing protein n=1 Tax=[Torrubiella] hemipterigena TaxID=1531966 RepID=A0A0A1TMT3_9HYPO|nr:hypothetical protein VHEMI08215 [[Torrubiella] hemipterigena]
MVVYIKIVTIYQGRICSSHVIHRPRTNVQFPNLKVAAIFLSAFVAAALGVPADHIVHEKRDGAAFVKRRTVDSDNIVPVRIALKQTNLHKGMDLLMDVSDPNSVNYGNHYTQDQVQAMFVRPSKSLLTRSKADFKTTVAQLKTVLHTKYNVFQTRSGDEHFGTNKYHLPADISDHVDFIYPGVASVPMARREERPSTKNPSMVAASRPIPEYVNNTGAEDCGSLITPKCIKEMYGIPDGTSKREGNELGIFELDQEMHKQSDLNPKQS